VYNQHKDDNTRYNTAISARKLSLPQIAHLVGNPFKSGSGHKHTQSFGAIQGKSFDEEV